MVASTKVIKFIVTLTATACVKTKFVDQTISDMRFTIDHLKATTVQVMPDWVDTIGSCGRRRY